MSPPFIRRYVGWKPWRFIKTYYNGDIVPFGRIPDSSLPASKIWGQGISIHCNLLPPWTNVIDPFTNLLAISTGSGTTLAGLTGGMMATAILMQEPSTATYAIGTGKGYQPPPTLGYCVGDLYKENVYFYLHINRISLGYLLTTFYSDVFQRSRLKRVYIQHGEILSYSKAKDSSGNEIGVLAIDYSGIVPTSILNGIKNGTISISGKIKITKKSNLKTYDLTIKGLRSNWNIETSVPPQEIDPVSNEPVDVYFTAGDFYMMDKVWCVEDPLIMSGYWLGNENEKQTGYPNSGTDSHITDHNHPYDQFSFTGAYIWKNTTGSVTLTSPQSSLNNINGGEWMWVPFENPPSEADASQFYSSNVRYKEAANVVISTTTAPVYATIGDTADDPLSADVSMTTIDGAQVSIASQKEFKFGEKEDITTWKNLWVGASNTVSSFIRMELNLGGGAYYQNWHSPNMEKCWLIQGGKYFKIYNQPNGNVIDIALRDVSNSSSLDTSDFAHSNIYNQYAWMLNEHYMTENYNGIFGGKILSSSYNSSTNESTIKIEVVPSGRGTFEKTSSRYNPSYLNNYNSYYNRFRLNPTSSIISSGTMVALYDKMINWKLATADIHPRVYNTKSISFSSFPTVRTSVYSEIIVVSGGSDLEVGTTVYLTFDTPYERFGDFPRGGSFFYDVSEGIEPTTIGGITANSANPSICLDLDWLSSPIVTFVPKETIIGVCGGRYWGLTGQGQEFIYSENGADLLFATPAGVLGSSAIYNKYVQEDWIVYKDPSSKITTVRRGTLDFREHPRRSEIAIGESSLIETISAPYYLNETQDRLKKISFDLPFATTNSHGENIMVAVSELGDIYGNLIAGKGEVDLQALRKQGIANGVTSVTNYLFDGHLASPVYVYKKNVGDCFYERNTMDVGIPTSSSPIYLVTNTASVSSSAQYNTPVQFEYVKNNKMLISNQLFDVYKTEDGEEIVVYGHPVLDFKIYGKTAGSTWVTPNAVFMIGNGNEANYWGCPLVKSLNYNSAFVGTHPTFPVSSDFQYPLMVVPCAEYLGSVYHYYFQRLYIFVRCYQNKSISFIGCYAVTFNDLITDIWKATNNGYLDFLYRPMSLDPAILSNINTSPLPVSSQTNLPVTVLANDRDRFSTVISGGSAINVVSPFVTKDGTLAALYDTDDGIMLAYARNSMSFRTSPIVIMKSAYSPLYMDDLVVFITNFGIGVKIAIDMNLYAAMEVGDLSNTAGNYQKYFELTQGDLDSKETILIGSGPVTTQKLTGYKTSLGVYKIFFYGSNGSISCMQSTNMRNWNYAPNF